MLVNRPNITEKNYRKLSLHIRPDGFSYTVTDTLADAILSIGDISIADAAQGFARDAYENAFASHEELSQAYDTVSVLHSGYLNTFVPRALFDEHYLGGYLQYNVKVFDSDAFAFDELPNYEMNNVYVPVAGANDFLSSRFGVLESRHASSVLVTRLLDISKNIDEKQVFAHFTDCRFELIVAQNQKLLLFNSFEYRTKEDFIYYLLFSAEQLSLNPEFFKLHLLGDISQDSECFRIAWKYVRNVSLLDVSEWQRRNGFSESDNRRHFILLQS